MQNEARPSYSTPFLAFLAGATLGAIVVALTTPRKGSDLREDLSDLGHRAKVKMGSMVRRGVRAAEAAGEDLQEGLESAKQDLRG